MSGLLLIGGGGHCLSVIDALDHKRFDKIGIIDVPERVGQEVCGIPVVGCDDDLEMLRDAWDCVFISLGSVGNWRRREKIWQTADKIGYSAISVMHSSVIPPPPRKSGRIRRTRSYNQRLGGYRGDVHTELRLHC